MIDSILLFFNGFASPACVPPDILSGYVEKAPLARGDIFENSNPKWVSNTIPIASNRVPIQKTYFGYRERYNPNLGILSPRDLFAESVVFYVLLL